MSENEDSKKMKPWERRYTILQSRHGGIEYYQVCEEVCGVGYTNATNPLGESLEELESDLVNMLEGVRNAIAENRLIVDGSEYDAFLLLEHE